MKIFIKTLKGDKQQVEVQTEHTVLQLKQQIAATQGHESDAQKLIFAGRILEDERPLSYYGLKENDSLVIMLSKPKPQPRAQTGPLPPPPQSDPLPATAANYEAAIQRVMELGFPRDQVEAAVRAAGGNPEIATEYLMTGIPMDEDQEEMAEDEEGEEEEGAEIEGQLSTLLNDPRFQQIREEIQANPETLRTLVEQLRSSNPAIAQLIEDHPEDVLEYLQGGAEGEEGQEMQFDPALIGSLPRPGNQLELTEEEMTAVRNLASLGFSEDDALEAYLSCDKNEAMAANLLFENYTPLIAQQRMQPGSGPR